MMVEPVFIGHNELGIRVYEIKEGGKRPMLADHQGNMQCRYCRHKAQPLRVTLQPVRSRPVEWALLCCPKCTIPFCLLKVKLARHGEHAGMIPGMIRIDNKEDADA